MRFDIFDTKEVIDINHLEEVTSPTLFTSGGLPDDDGLISNRIFGISTTSRKETFAYIDLHGHYFHPHIYKALLRMYRNVQKIIAGDMYVSIDENGNLVQDNENGQTGIEFLYDNWEKIKWKRSETESSMRNERIDLITGYPKNKIFMRYQIVIPAFTRDVKTSQSGGNSTDDINTYYQRLIRYSNTIANQGMFDIQFNMANMNIQNTIIDIYNYFKNRLTYKNGMIRKYLLGKTCDYCARSVITSAIYKSNTVEDMEVCFEYTAIPLSQICGLMTPFMKKWVLDFFERNVIDNKNAMIVYDQDTDTIISSKELQNPEIVFSDKYVDKMLETYMKDPESRLTKIEVPLKNGTKKYLAFTGSKVAEGTTELPKISTRPMCWTDLLYMAAVDVTKDKHCMITRYPILDEFGTFISKIRVGSTIKTEPMLVGETLYKQYPVINYDIPKDRIGAEFIDAIRMSNSYLKGLDK